MRNYNVVVWGLGPHAIRNILPAIRGCAGMKLYGVCSRNPEIVSKYAAEYECLGWTDEAAMLADPAGEVVYVSTPSGLHASQGRSVLNANKHFWCEKPLAETLADVLDLESLSRERGLSLAEGYMYLYHPQFGYLRELVDLVLHLVEPFGQRIFFRL